MASTTRTAFYRKLAELHRLTAEFAVTTTTEEEKPEMSQTETVPCWPLLHTVMYYTKRLLLYGPPGTGKTHVATPPDITSYSLTMTEDMPVAELRGHYVPHGNEFIWMDGPAIRAWREGVRLVINEIDKASAEAMTFLHVILDDPRTARLTLPTGETVVPHAGFNVIATMNGEPHDLPEALRDRFPVKILVDSINPEALEKLPEDLREVAHRTSMVKDHSRRLSIRAWKEYDHLRNKIGDGYAGPACFGSRWPELASAIKIKSAPGGEG